MKTDIPAMVTLNVSLSEDDRALIEARVQAGIYKDLDSYVHGLIRADLAADDWEVTPELEAAIAEGEASGYIDFDRDDFLKRARQAFLNETKSQFRSG